MSRSTPLAVEWHCRVAIRLQACSEPSRHATPQASVFPIGLGRLAFEEPP